MHIQLDYLNQENMPKKLTFIGLYDFYVWLSAQCWCLLHLVIQVHILEMWYINHSSTNEVVAIAIILKEHSFS